MLAMLAATVKKCGQIDSECEQVRIIGISRYNLQPLRNKEAIRDAIAGDKDRRYLMNIQMIQYSAQQAISQL
jgi:hypothetical protein